MRGKVFIVPLERRDITEGGVYLPDTAKRPEVMGRVLEVGPEVPSWVEKNALVIFKSFAGTEIQMEADDGEDVTILCMDHENIIGIVEEERDGESTS